MFEDKKILDACCGSKMFWFDKDRDDVLYMDNRILDTELCDGRKLEIKPDVVGDFTKMPFKDESFKLVIFDPPHLERAGEKSWLGLKYGTLKESWPQELKKGFAECFRVLAKDGILVFKWNEDQVKLSEVLELTDRKPLIGNKRAKTHFLIFMK